MQPNLHASQDSSAGEPRDDAAALDRTAALRGLNDALRQSFVGGAVMLAAAVAALPLTIRRPLMAAVRAFDAFEPGNDPYGEHDFGSVGIEGQIFFWKIDAYDLDMRWGSPDPTEPEVTRRVLTIMRAEDY